MSFWDLYFVPFISEYFQLWRHWSLSGPPLNEDLWGHSLFFWGKVGKILQLVSAMVIILELVGYDRISSIAERLNSVIKPARLLKLPFFLFVSPAAYVAGHIGEGLMKVLNPEREQTQGGYLAKRWIGNLGYVYGGVIVWLAFFAWLSFLMVAYLKFPEYSSSYTEIVFGFFLIVVPGVFALPIFLVTFPIYFILFLAKVSVAVLRQEKLSIIVGVGSVFVLLVGFQFDLLAS